MRRPILTGLLFLAGCVSGPQSPPGVGAVEITATAATDVDVDALKDGLENHPPRGVVFREVADYEPLALAFDKTRIETFFARRGYYTAKVTDIEVKDRGDRATIHFEVEPGPRSALKDIDIEGAPDAALMNAEALRLCSLLEVGERVDYDRIVEAEQRMTARLNHQGYASAKVVPRLQVERGTGDAIAHFLVDTGPLTYFGDALTSTASELPDTFVYNRVAWRRGDVFNPPDLEQTRARLLKTGLVDDVRFVEREGQRDDVLDVKIVVARGEPREFTVGAGVGLQQSFYELRGRIGYRHKSFIDPLTTVRLEARPAYAIFNNVSTGSGAGGKFNWEARAALDREDFVFPRVRGTVGANFERIQLDGYTATGPGAKVALGRELLDDRLQVALGVHVEQRNFSNVTYRLDEAERRDVGLLDPLLVGYVAPAITYDGRDNPLAPRAGFYASVRTEVGYVFSADASTFLTVTPELRGYLPLGDRVVLAGRSRFGVAALGLRPLPITHRIFGGGADGHRGFGRRRLAPHVPSTDDDAGLPVGGEAMLLTSAEVRVDLFEIFEQMFGLVAFVDVGDVVLELSQLDPKRLHVAVGPGARLDTPVGAVRLDVGFRVNRNTAGNPDPGAPFAFHLSLGEAF